MTSADWRKEIEAQRDLLSAETGVLFRLLDEIQDIVIGRDISNRRNYHVEYSALSRHLALLEDERQRLVLEVEALRGGSLAACRVKFERCERGLEEHCQAVRSLIEEWKREQAAGRRQRRRDRLWLDALLAQRERLLVEVRRLKGMAGGTSGEVP